MSRLPNPAPNQAPLSPHPRRPTRQRAGTHHPSLWQVRMQPRPRLAAASLNVPTPDSPLPPQHHQTTCSHPPPQPAASRLPASPQPSPPLWPHHQNLSLRPSRWRGYHHQVPCQRQRSHQQLLPRQLPPPRWRCRPGSGTGLHPPRGYPPVQLFRALLQEQVRWMGSSWHEKLRFVGSTCRVVHGATRVTLSAREWDGAASPQGGPPNQLFRALCCRNRCVGRALTGMGRCRLWEA